VPNQAELMVKLATDLERQKLLAKAKELNDLKKFIEYLETLTKDEA